MNNIKEIEFVFENCECVVVPIECFKKLYIKDLNKLKNKDSFEEMKCIIVDNGQSKYSFGFATTVTPIQRINQYNDITSIYITYNDDKIIQLYTPWYEENEYCNSQSNENQTTNMSSYNTVELSIIKNSKTYTLEQALNNLDSNTRIQDSKGNIYTIKINEGDYNSAHLENTIITLGMIQDKFTKVKINEV